MATDGRDRRRAALLAELARAAGKFLSVRDVMQRASLHPGERTEVKRVLRELVQEGALLRDGKRFAVPGARPEKAPPGKLAPVALARRRPAGKGELLGTLKKHRDGFGFVARLDRQGDDVFVPPMEADRALDGDLVRIEIVPARGGRTMGRILEVVERRRRLVIGTYHARGARSYVVPVDAELGDAVPVPETTAAEDGDVVKVALDPGARTLAGAVVEKIGRPGEPRAEVLRVAYAKGFADVFPPDVVAAAEATPDHVRSEDRAGRRDLTGLPLVTIDGEDARDFDDAVYVERLEPVKGKPRWRLVVAIADVAHYVRPGEPLDVEASRRATSVYFPSQVLPMLPERLSNGICSLNPAVDRLCMVADMVIDARGETRSAEVYEGVMRSAARCTYTEVARALAGERIPEREGFRAGFEVMAELQERLQAMRRARGAIDFDLPEAKIVLDGEGKPVAIEKRPRNVAHRIVEEFMLAANEAVARWFGARDLPTLYRVHGVPDEEKLAAFLDLAAAHGFEVPADPRDPRALNALLEALAGHPQQRALNQLLLRAMMQAVYSPENIGHYGLAAEHYLHFTSPIRRYPDLVVHRLLKEEWARRRDGGAGRRTPLPALEEKAVLSSERERAAMEAEREIAAYYAALFMKDKVGETFDGVVSAVVDFGVFVELRPFFVEGLVKAEDLGDAVELDPVQHALVVLGTGRSFRVGDELRVEVSNVSVQRRRIDLRPVGVAAAAAAQPPAQAGAPAPARREEAAPPRRERRALADAVAKAGRRRRAGEGHRERGAMSVEWAPGGQARRHGAAAGKPGKASKPGKGAPKGPRAQKKPAKKRRGR